MAPKATEADAQDADDTTESTSPVEDAGEDAGAADGTSPQGDETAEDAAAGAAEVSRPKPAPAAAPPPRKPAPPRSSQEWDGPMRLVLHLHADPDGGARRGVAVFATDVSSVEVPLPAVASFAAGASGVTKVTVTGARPSEPFDAIVHMKGTKGFR
jgi:hypothetical protein